MSTSKCGNGRADVFIITLTLSYVLGSATACKFQSTLPIKEVTKVHSFYVFGPLKFQSTTHHALTSISPLLQFHNNM